MGSLRAVKSGPNFFQKKEEQYRSFFEDSPISLWVEDFSQVKAHLNKLRFSGIKNFSSYFGRHPEAIGRCLGLVKIIDVNKATLKLYGAKNKEEILRGLGIILNDETRIAFKEELIAIAQGKARFEREAVSTTLGGERKNLFIKWSAVPGYEDTLSKVVVSIIDITDQKIAEEKLKRARDNLEKRVRRRTAELSKAQEALRQKNNALVHTLGHLQDLSRHILQVQENEYKSVSRELHDNIGQSLNAVKMRLERAEMNPGLVSNKGLAGLRREIREAVSQLRQISREIRILAKDRRPEILDELGLSATLSSYIRDFQNRTSIQVEFIRLLNDEHLPSNWQIHLYRIVQEALNNVARHALAKKAVIRLEKVKNNFVLSVKDDGAGFSMTRAGIGKDHSHGIGLTGIKERANLLGGSAEITSKPGKGTTLRIRIPFQPLPKRP